MPTAPPGEQPTRGRLAPGPRSKRSPRLASGGAIREAAASLFLENGYQGTSMDDIAAAAGVSKQTIYTHFANKEELFADLVLGNAARVEEFAATRAAVVDSAGSLEKGLEELARMHLGFVIRPEVLRLRRLVIGEATRFPGLARDYYEAVPGRVYNSLASLFQGLMRQGRLRRADPVLAAHHFSWLARGMPLDRALFDASAATVSQSELDRLARAATRAFVAAYGSPQRA